MSRLFPLLLVLLLPLGAVQAQQPAPAEITDAAWGIQFAPPDGWAQHPAAEGYLFTSPTQEAVLAVLPHAARTVEALRAEAARGITDAYGTRLQVTSSIAAFGEQGVAAAFDGWVEGSPARAYGIGLVAPQGRGVTVLVATAPQAFTEQHRALAEDVARSVGFTAPPETASAQGASSEPAGAEEQEWQDFLRGCRLYLSNSYDSGDGSGYIDETTIDLCPGYFTFSDHSLTVFNEMDPVSGNDPYLHSNQKGAGQWHVIRRGGASALQLRFHDGRTKTFALGWEDGKTFLDGQRWLRSCNPNISVGPRCD
ncbi:MAG: hypothetical protein GVY18_08415 [Bacteroidetes bacterium]|jgi:hypothetical protein|nr:hypothetical protein [Bacteroidota bacterium]